tara:strand:- start:132 stop:674 length:543 start_codon:yes stop_codon:yes gene_type:complete
MNLSKHRLLQIIREEITSLTEGEQEEPITPLERRWLRRTADKLVDLPPELRGNIPPEEDRGPVYHGARTARRGKRAREKVDVQYPRERKVSPEQAELDARFAALRVDEQRLERTIREEIELYLAEEEKWIQGAEEDIEKRGTEGVCTGEKFGGPTCRAGTKRYNLAKTFRKMAKKRKKKK